MNVISVVIVSMFLSALALGIAIVGTCYLNYKDKKLLKKELHEKELG